MDQPGHMNKKIRQARGEKVPFLLIAGEREVEERTVTVSQRGVEEQTTVPFDAFLERALLLAASRSLELG